MTTVPLHIATRKSPLALWQAERVQALLAERGEAATLVKLSTTGDRIQDKVLAEVGGKGLFVKELEEALRDGRADLAVHSAKDVPFALPEGLTLCAFPAREDPRDALVAPRARTFEALPRGARIGTSSLRRALQLLAVRPDLVIVPVRGNVQTRLGRASDGSLDAVILALAGLRRLGLEDHVTQVLPVDLSLPAAGQGALALEAIPGGRGALACTPLDHPVTARCVAAERAVLSALSGGCTVPIAAFAVEEEDRRLWLRAVLGGPDGAGGTRLLAAEARGPGTAPQALGSKVADLLRDAGGDALLAAAGRAPGLGVPR